MYLFKAKVCVSLCRRVRVRMLWDRALAGPAPAFASGTQRDRKRVSTDVSLVSGSTGSPARKEACCATQRTWRGPQFRHQATRRKQKTRQCVETERSVWGKWQDGIRPSPRRSAPKPFSGACDSAFLQLRPHIKEGAAPSRPFQAGLLPSRRRGSHCETHHSGFRTESSAPKHRVCLEQT